MTAERARLIEQCREEMERCRSELHTSIMALVGLVDWAREMELIEAEEEA